MMHKAILLLTLMTFFLSKEASAQVCDDLIASGCETALETGGIKVQPCNNGGVGIQYCHPRFYIGSGHNLTVSGSRLGKIVFDELLEKTKLNTGLTVRKAIGKNAQGQLFTGIFTYDEADDVQNCYIQPGADRSSTLTIPK